MLCPHQLLSFMENYNSLNHVLANMDKTIVYQKKSPVWPGVIILVSGAAIQVVNSLAGFNSSSFLPHLLMIVAIAVMIIGLIRIFFRKNHFYSPKFGRLFSKEIDFDVLERDRLIRLLKEDVGKIQSLKRSANNSLMLKIVSDKSGQICFSQVVQFQNFNYEEVSEVKQHSVQEAQILHSL